VKVLLTAKVIVKTRSSAVAERPRDTPCRWKFCQVTRDHWRSLEIKPL